MAEAASTSKLLQELQANHRGKANNVVPLLGTLAATQHEATLRAITQGLKVFFSDAGRDGQLKANPKQDAAQPVDGADPVQVYRAWLKRQYTAFTSTLITLATSAQYSSSVQVAAMSALMECVRSEQGPGAIASGLFVRTLSAVCTSPGVKTEVFGLLLTRFLRYADIRYYTLWTVRALASRHVTPGVTPPSLSKSTNGSNSSGQDAEDMNGTEEDKEQLGAAAGQLQLPLPDLCRNLFDVLTGTPASLGGQAAGQEGDVAQLSSWCGAAEVGVVSARSDKNESARARRKRKAGDMTDAKADDKPAAANQQQKVVWANVKSQKRLYSDAWLALLSLPIPSELLSKVLMVVHETVIPNMLHPALLADFLTHCLDQGGMTGMLALNGIFLLVTSHGLEYPAFYTRLYNLLTLDAFASKHRAQFFGLADIFLSSPLVPAYTVAACAKRFARLALRAPPAGALIAIAFIHNLIRRHPSCLIMLHNPGSGEGSGQASDPYQEEETEPSKCRAVESSLWEVEALRNHHCPQVATLCSVLDRDLSDKLKTTEVDIAPLLTTSYASLFNQEVTRRIKQVPIAFYAQAPTSLFGPHCGADLEGWQLPEGSEPALTNTGSV